MERENISYRLQSGKAQYIAKGGKVGRKTGYRKPKEEKAEQYSGVLKLLSKNYPIKMVSKLGGGKCQHSTEIEEGVLLMNMERGLYASLLFLKDLNYRGRLPSLILAFNRLIRTLHSGVISLFSINFSTSLILTGSIALDSQLASGAILYFSIKS